MTASAIKLPGRLPVQMAGGWEIGLLSLMALLYIGGTILNPAFFGTTDAIQALLRDTARFGVMAVGMTFVIANKDIDLSIGSTIGVIGVVFAYVFNTAHYDMGVFPAIVVCLVAGTAIGVVNGVLVTFLKVPAFIATLTILLIGRGVVLGLTGGRSILFPVKARDYNWFFQIGESNGLGFNNQIIICLVIVAIGAIVLAKTRWGYETLATGGNEQAAIYAGIPTNWVRIRAYIMSSLCATVAGLMLVAQNKGITSQAGLLSELIVIAAVIIGGASLNGGRGRVIGSYIGALLTGLIYKVLQEGFPITRQVQVEDRIVEVNATYTLPAGAVPAFIGTLLVLAVLIEPYVIRPQDSAAHLGAAHRRAAADPHRQRGHRHRRRADPRHAGHRYRDERAGHHQVPVAARRARDHPHDRSLVHRLRAAARTTGRDCQTASRSSSTSPSSRCCPSV